MSVWMEGSNAALARVASGYGGLFHGAYPALVTDLDDPDAQGRIKIQLPWSPDGGDSAYEAWARIATLMAGNDRGTWFVPDVDDEVLVVFIGGDPRSPCVVGSLWNGQDAPPQTMGPDNDIKQIRSRNGVEITIDDADGTESLRIETPGGQSLTLRDGPGSIKIEDSNQNSIELSTSGISVVAAQTVRVEGARVEVSAPMVQVDAAMSKFSGVVQADTVITNSVVSSSYTPGAGNIW